MSLRRGSNKPISNHLFSQYPPALGWWWVYGLPAASGVPFAAGSSWSPEAPTVSPLLIVFLVGCVWAEGGSLRCWLFPGYQKHLGWDYKAVGLSWEPESGLCGCWKAFPSGSCALPSVIRAVGEEGVSVRHGNFFLPVSSINLNAKTQTLWNAQAAASTSL